MLSNKDFSQLLQGSKSKSTANEKVRFDLNQIRTWDRQNEAQLHRKGKSKNFRTPRFDEDGAEEEVELSHEYRDRAKERREDANPDYDEPMDVIAKLDAEQTKYLGGDIDHTYLVKGLDYALLQKARQQVQQAKEAQAAAEATQACQAVTTKTPLGAALKSFLVNNAASSAPKPLSVPVNFSLMCYVYDLEDEQDIPTVIYRSKQDIQDNNALCVSLPSALLSSISSSVVNAAKHRSGGKKTDYYSNEEVKSFHTKPAPMKSFDIFEDVGKFDPRQALENMVAARTTNAPPVAASTKYFDSKASETIPQQQKSDDLLAPVKKFIQKETMRTTQHSMVVEEGVRHRDIIGGSKTSTNMGEAMEIYKEYDVSQFELNDYGGYSDDDDYGGFGGTNTGKRGGYKGKNKSTSSGGLPNKKRK